jgi:hypothetical protein
MVRVEYVSKAKDETVSYLFRLDLFRRMRFGPAGIDIQCVGLAFHGPRHDVRWVLDHYRLTIVEYPESRFQFRERHLEFFSRVEFF